MHNMWFKLLLVSILCSAPVLAAKDTSPWHQCKNTEALTHKWMELKLYKATHAEQLVVTMRKEPSCDDGALAEAATDIVCKASVNDFKAVIEYGKSSDEARSFILRHIDSAASNSDLAQIISLEKRCRKETRAFCIEVVSAAKAALKGIMLEVQTSLQFLKRKIIFA